MRPAEIIDRQIELLDRLDSYKFRGAFGSVIAGEMWEHQDPKRRDTPEMIELRARVSDEQMLLMRRHVQTAYAFHVTADMCDLLTWAADGLENDDKWDRSLAPTGCGIVHFDKPIVIGGAEDDPEAIMTCHWMIWGPGEASPDGRPRTILWWIDDDKESHFRQLLKSLNNSDDYDQNRMRSEIDSTMGNWSALMGWDSFPDGMALGDPVIPMEGSSDLFNSMKKRVGIEWAVPEAAVPGAIERLWQTNDARITHALWLLLQQTVVTQDIDNLDRATRRRATRKRIPPRVTVIKLRRSNEGREHGESEVEWQHRWIVRGHWRWQACGPNYSERRRIWISPFIKGPEDAPLKQSEKVYSLQR